MSTFIRFSCKLITCILTASNVMARRNYIVFSSDVKIVYADPHHGSSSIKHVHIKKLGPQKFYRRIEPDRKKISYEVNQILKAGINKSI